jgi:transposase
MEADESKPEDWREGRRRRAFELRQLGRSENEIAQALGVTQGAVSQWLARGSPNGESAWLTKQRPGRPPKLTQPQRLMIPDMLSHGAEAWGFRGELWTSARVACVLRWQFGVSYH